MEQEEARKLALENAMSICGTYIEGERDGTVHVDEILRVARKLEDYLTGTELQLPVPDSPTVTKAA